MGRPLLSICLRCATRGHHKGRPYAQTGEALFEEVRSLRKQRALKQSFKVDGVSCLRLCDTPCAAELSGKKRSTLTRTHLTAADAVALVDAAVAYSLLGPGEELPERLLPGVHAD